MDPDLPVEVLLEEISRLLGKLSRRIGVAVVPGSGGGVITKIETISAGNGRLMLSVTTGPGIRRSAALIEIPGVCAEDIRDLVAGIAGRIIGKRCDEARCILRSLALPRGRRGRRLERLRGILESLLQDRGCDVHLSGTGNVVPEISPGGKVREFLEALESRQMVADLLLSGPPEKRTVVTLGSETAYRPFKGCGIIASTYRIGADRGALGIIGPVRMDYPRLMAVLEFTTGKLNRLFAGRGGEQRVAAQRQEPRRRA
jgi:heat-inducible transcriptional repressor